MFSLFQQSRQWLQRPVSFFSSIKDKFFFITFCSIFAFAFFLIFQPFGVNNYDPTHRIGTRFLLGISLLAGGMWLTLALNEFGIRPLLFQIKNRGHLVIWTIWTLLLLSSASFLFYNLLGEFHDWYWRSYLGFLRDVSNMMLLPFLMIFFFFHHRSIKRRYLELAIPDNPDSSNGFLYFESENGKESLTLSPEALLFIEAQENYISIHYSQDGTIKKALLRSTLKRIEGQFSERVLLRCHRSYLVATPQISQVMIKYRQIKLQLHQGCIELPVSRKYEQRVKMLLKTAQSSHRSTNHPKVE